MTTLEMNEENVFIFINAIYPFVYRTFCQLLADLFWIKSKLFVFQWRMSELKLAPGSSRSRTERSQKCKGFIISVEKNMKKAIKHL